MNFSSIRQKVKTQVFTSLSLLFWALAATSHLVHNFGEREDNLAFWIIEIFAASLFAVGFGWHLQKLITLHRMEKRGSPTFIEEF